ncbi:hypothetical protein [Magnetofaba australis]|uniref:hypothetical protein n=1 Tax=Magnetofaba australis TaxID=1472297 RepID=UPI000A19DCFB|nr:hypothetical protein [Magnetofaba australis]
MFKRSAPSAQLQTSWLTMLRERGMNDLTQARETGGVLRRYDKQPKNTRIRLTPGLAYLQQ